jgi:hypothetical protein
MNKLKVRFLVPGGDDTNRRAFQPRYYADRIWAKNAASMSK